MNKKIIIGIIVVVCLIFGIVTFSKFGADKKEDIIENKNKDSNETEFLKEEPEDKKEEKKENKKEDKKEETKNDVSTDSSFIPETSSNSDSPSQDDSIVFEPEVDEDVDLSIIGDGGTIELPFVPAK